MTKTITERFQKIPLTLEQKTYIKRWFSLKKLFLVNTVLFLPFLFGLIVCSFFPWFPHSTYGFGAQNPSSPKKYLEIVGKSILIVLCFVIFLIFLTTIFDFLRAQVDLFSGFRRVGVFSVTSIREKKDVKLITLSNGKRLKRKSSEIPFNKLIEQDIVEICESATGRPVSFRILH